MKCSQKNISKVSSQQQNIYSSAQWSFYMLIVLPHIFTMDNFNQLHYLQNTCSLYLAGVMYWQTPGSHSLLETGTGRGRHTKSNITKYYFLFFFLIFRATPAAYGRSQASGWMGAAAAGLHHSHSNARSRLCLRPIPQLTAMPDSQLTEWGQGSNPCPHGH